MSSDSSVTCRLFVRYLQVICPLLAGYLSVTCRLFIYYQGLAYFFISKFWNKAKMQQIKLSMTKFFVLCDTCWISFSRHATFLGLHVSCNHGLSRFTNILFVLIYNLTDTRQCNLFGKSFDLFLHKIFFRLAAGVNSTLHPILFCFFVFLAQIPGIHSNLTVFLVLNPSLVSFLRFTFFINNC